MGFPSLSFVFLLSQKRSTIVTAYLDLHLLSCICSSKAWSRIYESGDMKPNLSFTFDLVLSSVETIPSNSLKREENKNQSKILELIVLIVCDCLRRCLNWSRWVIGFWLCFFSYCSSFASSGANSLFNSWSCVFCISTLSGKRDLSTYCGIFPAVIMHKMCSTVVQFNNWVSLAIH